MRRFLNVFIAVVLLIVPSANSILFAQDDKINVSGVVRDIDGLPMAGVSVMVPGTQNGVNTFPHTSDNV